MLAEYGFAYRKAMYLISIAETLLNAEIPFEKVKGISWSKLKEVAKVLTAENVDEWVAKIKGPPELTFLQINELVKEFMEGSLDKNEVPESAGTEVSTLSFKLHKDQRENIEVAIAKAKLEAETEYAAVALDAICMNYNSGATVVKDAPPKPLSDQLSGYSPEEVLEAFELNWPEIDVVVKMPAT